MSNRRVKSLAFGEDDFGDDDYDQYDDEEEEYNNDTTGEELTAEDKENLRQETIKVKENLGPAYQVSDQEIQDTLWNYYYDIGKSVTYLKNKHKPKTSIGSTALATPKTTPKPKHREDKASTPVSLTTSVKNINISETPKLKSRNLDVLAEYKKVKRKNAANFVVIGHVDAGKSTLMGRLLFDLKAVDQRTIDKYKKEADQLGKGSFAFAWVLDQGTEERERGVTIDIAQNQFATDKTNFTILDAPGHQDFVPNMIAGASQADFAVLVVDASTGNFESGLRGQTREHALLAKSIGVQRIIVAVNKMDTVDWSQKRFDEIQREMTTLLKAANFKPASTAFVPCSGLEGGNILTPTTDSSAKWYTGKTLVELLDDAEPIVEFHKIEKPLRLTIADVFRGGVQNPLSISGRIEAGNLQVGQQIVVMPSAEKASIKGIEVDNNTDTEGADEWAVAGQNVILHLTDIDPIHLRSGDVVCDPKSSPIQNVQSFHAQILSFTHITPMLVDVHRGRLHVAGRVAQLVATLDKKSAGSQVLKKKPKIVQPESLVRITIELDHAVPLEKGDRIVLRAGGETIAAGLIE